MSIESLQKNMPERRHDDKEVAVLIERLARLMRASEHEAGLNPAQWEALRYLARCNRFSNSPGALTAYLAATKGTVSQTILALERKGLIRKTPRPGKGRSIALTLTKAGEAILRRDPWRRVSTRAMTLAPHQRGSLNDALIAIVTGELADNRLKTFGVCRSCRFFMPGGMTDGLDRPHRCGLLKVDLSGGDADLICVEHAALATG